MWSPSRRTRARIALLAASLLLGMLVGLAPHDADAQRGPRNRPPRAPAPPPPPPPRTAQSVLDVSPDVALVIKETPLEEAVRAIAARSGYDYIFEPPLPGRVTVAVPAHVTPEEAGEILQATLKLKGFVALPMQPGRFRIVRWEKMAGEAPYEERKLDPNRASSLTTRIQLKHASPELVARSLNGLIPGGAEVVAYMPSGSLIFAGAEDEVHRLIEIAQQLDAAQHDEMMVRRIRYKDAGDLQQQLEALTEPPPDRNVNSTEVEIELDQRTNSLIITGSPEQLAKLRTWIDMIDVPVVGEGEIQVVPLYFQDPVELAKLLNDLGQGAPATQDESELDAGPLTNREYNIVAHEPTHALLIQADRGTFEVLAQLIAQLDREPRSVHIEATFYEITTDGTLGFGAGGIVPAIEPKEQDDLGLVFLPNLALSPNGIPGVFEPDPDIAALGGRIFSISGESVVIPVLGPDGNQVLDASGNPQVITAPGLGLSLLAADTHVEIEVTNRPSLVLIVGEESKIFAGDEVPIPQGSTNLEDLVRLGPSIRVDFNRENIGTELTLTARHNEGGDILIDMLLELSLVRLDQEIDVETGPVLSNRRLEGTFRVAPGQRSIVAGLESENESRLRSGIPFLSAIPFFGRFFTVDLETLRRTYLVIEIQADVIPTQDEKRARDLALAEAVARRQSEFVEITGSRYAVRAASYTRREIAEASRDSLRLDRIVEQAEHSLRIVERQSEDGPRFDLFVLGFNEMADVARAALALEIEGLAPEVIPLAGALAAAN